MEFGDIEGVLMITGLNFLFFKARKLKRSTTGQATYVMLKIARMREGMLHRCIKE